MNEVKRVLYGLANFFNPVLMFGLVAFFLIAGVYAIMFVTGTMPCSTTASVFYPDTSHKGGVQFEARNRWGAVVITFRDYGFDGGLDEVELYGPDGSRHYTFDTGETEEARAWAEWSPRYYEVRREATTGQPEE
ncbi:MAG: hypothetical protein UX68_C0014G0022 [Parcubacteria group bacterium GW2011_GWA2_46_9]|nr:MAG: hypothetical protein UX68_C0014G0022 [Parcubacteria group bacterium GW2011_GWA2_46_9]